MLLPFQGECGIKHLTQGVALGLVLLPFQGISIINYQLSIVKLSIVNSQLSIVNCQLSIINYQFTYTQLHGHH